MGINTSSTTASKIKPKSVKKPSYLVTGEDLLNSPIVQLPYLWELFFIQQGLIALTGGSDVGKSSFLRQLAISVVLKEKTFLGSSLNVRHGKAIYLATEDNKVTAQLSLQRSIAKGVKPSDLQGLCYLINPDNPFAAIERELKTQKADVVIVDSFGDVFNGNLNDNTSVRACLNKYQKLSEKYDVLFIFLHHTGKRTENNGLSKNNVIGSQAFEAKMRLVMELRKPDGTNRRDLHFTKGNYLSEKVKAQSLQLTFDNNQLFHFVGNTTSTATKERAFSQALKDEIIKIGKPLQENGLSLENIRDALKNQGLQKIPSKGTLHQLLANTKLVQSA